MAAGTELEKKASRSPVQTPQLSRPSRQRARTQRKWAVPLRVAADTERDEKVKRNLRAQLTLPLMRLPKPLVKMQIQAQARSHAAASIDHEELASKKRSKDHHPRPPHEAADIRPNHQNRVPQSKRTSGQLKPQYHEAAGIRRGERAASLK